MSNVEVIGKNSKGEDVTCFVRRPTSKDTKEAKVYANANVAKAIKGGSFLTRGQAREQLRKSGIWTDANEQELLDTTNEITFYVNQLTTGADEKGVKLKKSKGREIALKVIELRDKQMNILTKVNELDEWTIESQAENDEFDYLLSSCLLDEQGERVFASVDEYKEKADNEPYYVNAARELQNIIYGFKTMEDVAKDRIEFKFLRQFNFVNEKLQFINKDGHLTDRDGKLVDEEGYYVNASEERLAKEETVGEFEDD